MGGSFKFRLQTSKARHFHPTRPASLCDALNTLPCRESGLASASKSHGSVKKSQQSPTQGVASKPPCLDAVQTQLPDQQDRNLRRVAGSPGRASLAWLSSSGLLQTPLQQCFLCPQFSEGQIDGTEPFTLSGDFAYSVSNSIR